MRFKCVKTAEEKYQEALAPVKLVRFIKKRLDKRGKDVV